MFMYKVAVGYKNKRDREYICSLYNYMNKNNLDKNFKYFLFNNVKKIQGVI